MSDIIFLDIDGVLRTHKSDSEWSEKLNTPIFKKELIDYFRKIQLMI
jgi:histidinol phosphatase-like enzyme